MKNLIVSLLAGLFIPCILQAQYNRIKVDPVDFIFSTATLQYERFFPNQWSAQVGLSLTRFETVIWEDITVKVSGIGVSPEVRYYFRPYATVDIPQGFFGGGWARYNNGHAVINSLETETISKDLMDVTAYSGGIMGGYQHIIWNRLCIEAIVGGGYRYSKIGGRMAEAGEKFFFTRSGFALRAGLGAGIAF